MLKYQFNKISFIELIISCVFMLQNKIYINGSCLMFLLKYQLLKLKFYSFFYDFFFIFHLSCIFLFSPIFVVTIFFLSLLDSYQLFFPLYSLQPFCPLLPFSPHLSFYWHFFFCSNSFINLLFLFLSQFFSAFNPTQPYLCASALFNYWHTFF